MTQLKTYKSETETEEYTIYDDIYLQWSVISTNYNKLNLWLCNNRRWNVLTDSDVHVLWNHSFLWGTNVYEFCGTPKLQMLSTVHFK